MSITSGAATSGPKSSKSPRPTASPTPQPTHTAPIPVSPLFVDGPAGRIYASGPMSGTARLAVYDTRDGRLVATAPLATDERLLDIDRERRRLYVYRPAEGVRLLDADSLGEVGRVGLPTPDPADDKAIGFSVIGWHLPRLPLIHPITGQIATFGGMTVRLYDVPSGAEVDAFGVPLDGEDGPITNASFSDDGRLLYVAVADRDLASADSESGAILVAFDMRMRRIIERRDLRAPVSGWLAWSSSLLVEGEAYKDIGLRYSLWVDGHERRRLVGAQWDWNWLAFDAQRGRLLGVFTPHGRPDADGRWHAVAEAASLDLQYLTPIRGDPALSAYDGVTDQFFGRGPDARQLSHVGAESIAPDSASTDVPAPRQTVRVLSAVSVVASPAQAASEPLAFTGVVAVMPEARTPTPRNGGAERIPTIRRDGDATWYVNRPAGVPSWPDMAVAAPPASGVALAAGTLFGVWPGLGVFRSADAGRSWQPASAGIDALSVRDIDVSPDFAHDRTLFAASFTTCTAVPTTANDDDPTASAWRSRDAGTRWEPVGCFAALAISPDFARDRTVMAFEHLGARFFVSTDGGDHWAARGRLGADDESELTASETWIIPATGGRPRVVLALATNGSSIGGSAHWPEWSLQPYRSTDDGMTWDLAWSPDQLSVWPVDPFNEADLLGETADTWVLRASSVSNQDGVFLSRDGGLSWQQHFVADDPLAMPLTVLPGGRVIVRGGQWGDVRAVTLDAFAEAAAGEQQP